MRQGLDVAQMVLGVVADKRIVQQGVDKHETVDGQERRGERPVDSPVERERVSGGPAHTC